MFALDKGRQRARPRLETEILADDGQSSRDARKGALEVQDQARKQGSSRQVKGSVKHAPLARARLAREVLHPAAMSAKTSRRRQAEPKPQANGLPKAVPQQPPLAPASQRQAPPIPDQKTTQKPKDQDHDHSEPAPTPTTQRTFSTIVSLLPSSKKNDKPNNNPNHFPTTSKSLPKTIQPRNSPQSQITIQPTQQTHCRR
jgi:hypothetical protein